MGCRSIPSPLVGEGREGGNWVACKRRRSRQCLSPPPLTPPHNGEGNSVCDWENSDDLLERPTSPHCRRRHWRARRRARAGAARDSFAGRRSGRRIQGDRRRHPARAQRVLDVRKARPDRVDQRARGVSKQSRDAGFDHRRGSHAHFARRHVPQKIPSSLCVDPSRRFPSRAARCLPQIQSHPARRVAEDRRSQGKQWRNCRKNRKRQGLSRRGFDRRRRIMVDHPRDRGRGRQAEARRPYHLSRRAADVRSAGNSIAGAT